MVLRKLPVIILVFLPAFVWANSYYQFNLQLGGEYQERERIQGGESVTIAEEMHIFANIRFTSHLWSPRILKYMLLFNVDNSDDKIDEYAYTRETIGYGLHLTFFPYNRDKLELMFGNDTYQVDTDHGTDYSHKATYLGMRGRYRGWFLSFENRDIRPDNSPQNEKSFQNGELKKSWRWGSTALNLDAKRRKDERAFFNTAYTYQNIHAYSQTYLESDGTIQASLTLQETSFLDSDQGFENSDQLLRADLVWTQQFSERWNTYADLTVMSTESGNRGVSLQTKSRHRLTSPFSVEFSLDYTSLSTESISSQYPSMGVRAIYLQKLGYTTFNLQAGGEYHGKRSHYYDEPSLDLYGMAHISRIHKKSEAEITLEYSGFETNLTPYAEDDIYAERDYRFLEKSDIYRLRSQYRLKLRKPGSKLNWWGKYEKYDQMFQTSVATDVITSQLLFQYSRIKLSAGYQDFQEESLFRNMRHETWKYTLTARLNSFLVITADWVERERMFEGALSTEEDMRVVLGYTYGKFMFNSRYERRRDISEFDTREYNVFAVTLIRNFGNE